jgi:deazaflavin-dependent oxidoreductase (nitroreductase family)
MVSAAEPAPLPAFRRPSRIERWLNRFLGFLFSLGLGPSFGHLLEVPGRRSGRLFRTPVNVLEHGGERYLVAPRGETAWTKNARAAGRVVLKRGKRETVSLVEVTGDERLEVLAAYLKAYSRDVQRFFTVPAGSPPEAFRSVEASHPVFRLALVG